MTASKPYSPALARAERPDLSPQLTGFERLLDEQRHFIEVERLVDVMECAELHRLDGVLDRRESGHEDHQRLGGLFLDAAQQGDAIVIGQAEIEQHEIDVGCELRHGFRAGARFEQVVVSLLSRSRSDHRRSASSSTMRMVAVDTSSSIPMKNTAAPITPTERSRNSLIHAGALAGDDRDLYRRLAAATRLCRRHSVRPGHPRGLVDHVAALSQSSRPWSPRHCSSSMPSSGGDAEAPPFVFVNRPLMVLVFTATATLVMHSRRLERKWSVKRSAAGRHQACARPRRDRRDHRRHRPDHLRQRQVL